MSSTPNYKARLKRAARNALPVYSGLNSFRRFKLFTIFLVIIFPIYPSLSALGNMSVTAIGDYDESSILTTFTDTDGLEYISETWLVSVGRGEEIISETTPKKEADNAVPESNIRTYTVVEYDDIIKIGKKYNIAPEVILWSNNLSMSDTLVVGQTLKIPPVSGIVHTLKSGETISSLAKKYSVSQKEILEYNNISDATKVRDGTKLMIPGAKMPEPVVVTPKPAVKTTPEKKTTNPAPKIQTEKPATEVRSASSDLFVTEEASQAAPAQPATNEVRYPIKFTGLGRGFVPGNCTWHVARHKVVTWRGNANQWIKNARAQGVPTGKTPAIGAIVQFSGHGYNAYYGHVGIVTDIQGDHIIVSDMNYSGLYQVTIRKVAKNHPAIDGYIYAQ